MRLADLKARSPHEISQAISLSRRNFLRAATGAASAAAFFGPAALRGMAIPKNRKAVVVTFGGGARDDETFAPDGQENSHVGTHRPGPHRDRPVLRSIQGGGRVS